MSFIKLFARLASSVPKKLVKPNTDRCCFVRRLIHSTCIQQTSQPNHEFPSLSGCSDLIELHGTWPTHEQNGIYDDMRVIPNFLSADEEELLLKEIEPHISRLQYEYNHWDDAIHAFRETERKKWFPHNRKILDRVSNIAFGGQIMPYVHVLDLAKDGVIKPHVDSTRYCGNVIAGLSLLSNCVMRLKRTDEMKYKQLPQGMVSDTKNYRKQSKSSEDIDYYANVFLPRRSLYIMKDSARYKFTHEVLSNEYSKFSGRHVLKDRRISVICRNNPTQVFK